MCHKIVSEKAFCTRQQKELMDKRETEKGLGATIISPCCGINCLLANVGGGRKKGTKSVNAKTCYKPSEGGVEKRMKKKKNSHLFFSFFPLSLCILFCYF
eukprot:TRINITY_DN4130_c0_g1_i1.p1 TRINITY_DN4130_c0_g1~~TRINITY_DN4130_c0_g1_i1.p1  ORF type:complete len:100 (-),score=8.73 TRINITY_DN4130_c0_g1_i1:1046-1345(-)